MYALNDDLEVMWHFQSDKNTGHFPFAIDINGDGHDELLVGYNMLDCHGNKMWTMPVNETILMRLFLADLSQDHTKVLNSLPVLQERKAS